MKITQIANSSNINRVAHDGKDLLVDMRGGMYRYLDVPVSLYEAMIVAESAGTFLNSNIKKTYDFKKFEADEVFPTETSGTGKLVGTMGANFEFESNSKPANNYLPLNLNEHGVSIIGTLTKGTEESAGYDLITTIDVALEPGQRFTAPTGVFVHMPRYMAAWVTPRSGHAHKLGVTVLNAPGLIDPDYTKEIGVVLINLGSENVLFKAGDRIAQLVFTPFFRPTFRTVESFEATGRTGGFGSTGTSS